MADSTALWDEGRQRDYGPTDAGRELTSAATSGMQELFAFPHLPGLPATGIRHYVGDDTADLLGVPPADWTRVFFKFVEHTDSLGRTVAHFPGARSLTAALGRRVWQGFEWYGRAGERPGSQVTDELKQAWGMTTP